MNTTDDRGRRWPWNPIQAVVLAAAAFFFAQFGGAGLLLAGSRIFGAVTGRGLPADSTAAQFATILLIEGLIVLAVAWILRQRGLRLRDIGLRRFRARDVLLALAALAAYLAAFLIVSSLVKAAVPGLDVNQKQDIGFTGASGGSQLLLVFVSLAVLPPIAEETLFRGFLFTGLRRWTGFVPATLVTSAIFGFAHLFGGTPGASLLWIAGLDTLILSLALCYLREKTGRLWPSILLHAMKNSLAFVVLFIVGS